MKKIVLFVFALIPMAAYAQGQLTPEQEANVQAFEICDQACDPFDADKIEIAPTGELMSCVCQSRRITRQDGGTCLTCCTPGQSQPCGNACISLDHTCHQEPGTACYCPEEESAE
jgi:hypothetical protein